MADGEALEYGANPGLGSAIPMTIRSSSLLLPM